MATDRGSLQKEFNLPGTSFTGAMLVGRVGFFAQQLFMDHGFSWVWCQAPVASEASPIALRFAAFGNSEVRRNALRLSGVV